MAKEEVLQMTQREIDRLKILHKAIEKRITQEKAGQLLDLCRVHVNRLCRKIKNKGDKGIIHGLRGQPSNHQLTPGLADKAVRIIKEKYSDFRPGFAAEKLLEVEGLKLSGEKVRQLMIAGNLWQDRKRRAVHREWRARRDCFGEMIQLDGSDHDWFEGRRDKCILLAAIDDATNRIFLRFTEHEDTRNLMQFSRAYMNKFGRPKSIYVDKDSIYITNRQPNLEEELQGRKYALTQFSRALETDLDIKVINAGSPQAKGRVERLFETLQDRLVKELRLAGISNLPAANRFLEQIYLAKHNAKFSVAPKCNADVHRPVRKTRGELDAIFSFQEARVIGNDYTIRWKNRLLQIAKYQPYFLLPRTKVMVEERLNGKIRIRYKSQYLKMREIDQQEIRKPPVLKPILSPIKPLRYNPHSIPAANHPWRQYQQPRRHLPQLVAV